MRRLLCSLLCVLLIFSLVGCGGKNPSADTSSAAASSSGSSSAASSAPATPTSYSGDEDAKPFDKSSVTWEDWDGVVEHLFFHPIIAYPESAFRGDYKAEDLDEWMITAEEYQKILQSLYDNGYVLVDINQVWHEETGADGKAVMVRSKLQVPEGKKPIILSYDDVNYYEYMLQYGFTYKLVVGGNGQLWSYGKDPQGNDVYAQDLDAVTYLDKFCRAHPDFTPYGAKGCLSLTGYEGILGYRTQTDTKSWTDEQEAARQKEIEAVKPVVAALKAEGWTFGSHTWGHIRLDAKSLAAVQADNQRWMDEVGSLVGPTSILFYPHGARPDGDDVKQSGPIFQYLHAQGFRVFCSVGIESYSKIKSDPDSVICDRLHADGTTLRHSRDRYLKLYDAKTVMDTVNRPNLGVDWN